MSSILRGTRLLVSHSLCKITRVASSRGPKAALRKQPLWMSPSLTRNLSSDPAPLQSNTPQTVDKLSEVEKRLELMDSSVRWRGRVDKEDVEGVVYLLKNEEHVSEQQALMLLRCAGSLMVKENPGKRMEIFNNIWTILKEKGVELKTAHYNAALRVQMENKHKFVATDVLTEMQASDEKKPNRVTFQLLVARYCEDGDVDGATKILQFMKAERIPINETVFNSLIKGHLKRGDTQGAEGVMESMRSSGLEPSGDTYKVILCCHAENGDIGKMQQTIEDAQKDEVRLSSAQLFAAVLVLSDCGHEQLIEQMLTHIPANCNHDTLNCVHQLIAQGRDDAAIKVYNNLRPEEATPEAVQAGARSVLRTMVLNDRPIETLKSTLDILKSAGKLGDTDIEIITMFALSYKKLPLAVDAIKLMKQNGLPVRPHFFWPIYIYYKKNGDVEGLHNAVSVMAESAERNIDYIPSLYRNAFKALLSLSEDPTTIVTKFQESGVKTDDINTVQLLHLLNTGEVNEAVQFLENSPFTFNAEEIKDAIIGAMKRTKDWSGICEAISHMQNGIVGSAANFSGDLFTNLLRLLQDTPEEQIQLAELWAQKELPLGTFALGRAKKALTTAGADEALLTKLADNTKTVRRSQPLVRQEIESMSEEKLEMELRSRKPTDRDLNTIRKHLLMKFCTSGKVEKADALKSDLEEEGFTFDAFTLRQLSFLAANHKKDVEEAIRLKNQMEEKYPEFSGYTRLVTSIAILQAKSGNFEDAQATLTQYTERHGKKMENFSSSYELVQDANRLVEAFGKQAEPGQTRQLVQLLFDQGFIKAGTFSLLQEVVKAHLNKQDMEGLLDTLEQYHRDYNRVPLFSDVFRALIKNEDAERLQKVVDMVTTLNGEIPVLHTLVLSFIECGQTKKARKILETPGLCAHMPTLKVGIDKYIQQRKEDELRQLIDVTKDLFALDKDEMLFGLMRLQAAKKNVEECMDVLAMYEEYGVKPRPRTLRYLAKVLESDGREVPFEVPGIVEKTASLAKGSSPIQKDVIKAMKTGEIDTLCNIITKRSADDLSAEFITEIAAEVPKTLGAQPFKQLTYMMGESADVAGLKAVLETEQLSAALRKHAKKQLLCAHIKSGQCEEIISEMEAQPLTVNDYVSVRALTAIAEKDPALLSRVEAVIERQLAEAPGQIGAANCLFDHWVRTGQIDKAETLWRSHSEFQMKLKLMNLSVTFREQKDEERLRWLLSLVKDVSKGKESLLYSQLIALKNSTGDWQGALSVCEEARASGLEYSSLWNVAMKQVEVQLLANNQQPPWQVGLFDKKDTPSATNPNSEQDSQLTN